MMFQREVAERLVARPGAAAYGRLSVITQWLCRTSLAFAVDRRAFVPPPKVTSVVVSLDPYPAPLADATWPALEAVTRAAFAGRMIVAGGYDLAKAQAIVAHGLADAVAFGRPFIANPDLPERLRLGRPLAGFNASQLFGGTAAGYSDYPAWVDTVAA